MEKVLYFGGLQNSASNCQDFFLYFLLLALFLNGILDITIICLIIHWSINLKTIKSVISMRRLSWWAKSSYFYPIFCPDKSSIKLYIFVLYVSQYITVSTMTSICHWIQICRRYMKWAIKIEKTWIPTKLVKCRHPRGYSGNWALSLSFVCCHRQIFAFHTHSLQKLW